jgi:hypothetical protein
LTYVLIYLPLGTPDLYKYLFSGRAQTRIPSK